jgi:hypothetical protein
VSYTSMFHKLRFKALLCLNCQFKMEGIRRSTAEMVGVSASRASAANERRAKSLLETRAGLMGTNDPDEVSEQSSNFVLNILYSYVKLDHPDGAKLLGKDSMGAMIQGLQMCYDNAGHTSNWQVGPDGSATGNPLRGNIDVSRLRKAHRAKLAEIGRTSKRATPITEEHVCKHFAMIVDSIPASYDTPNGEADACLDIRPWALHAIWVIGLHCGLRYDELSKLQLEGTSFGEQIRITLPFRTKNSLSFKEYEFVDWPTPELASCHGMDPTLALCLWLKQRGDEKGHLFCNIASSGRLEHNKPWDSKKFIDYMRSRLHLVGEGHANVAIFSSHSIKRGSVQLYRKIGMSDQWIMRRIKMVGEFVYLRYTGAFNDAAPQDLPEFANVSAAISWAAGVSNILSDALDTEEYDMLLEATCE